MRHISPETKCPSARSMASGPILPHSFSSDVQKPCSISGSRYPPPERRRDSIQLRLWIKSLADPAQSQALIATLATRRG